MSQDPNRSTRLLVLVEPNGSALRTVEHAMNEARDSLAEFGGSVVVDVRVLVHPDDPSSGTATRTEIEGALSGTRGGDAVDSRVATLPALATQPADVTERLRPIVGEQDVSRIVLAADTGVSVERLRETFGVGRVELVTADVARDRWRLLHPRGVRRFVTVFGLTYLFYLAIGGFVGGLDLLTGAVSAGIVALSLARVALHEEPTLGRTARRLGRMVVFLPVLLWEVVKANFVIAYVILHPRLPIDPSMETLETDTREGLERMVLANSITLTPGTLTVDVRERTFTIHSLTAGARADLEDGRLQRLVAWVFHGGEGGHRADDGGGVDR
ncbi:MAG: Na+/H+ antiporter subunit E [Halobacteriales archaeon]|nr:Na+/H+ antiporter subunit E [Halobacteriales archaeon]